MGLARGTVRKFAQAELYPERSARAPGPSLLDPFLPHLEARLAWALIRPANALDGEEAAAVARVERNPEAARVVGLARRLHNP